MHLQCRKPNARRSQAHLHSACSPCRASHTGSKRPQQVAQANNMLRTRWLSAPRTRDILCYPRHLAKGTYRPHKSAGDNNPYNTCENIYSIERLAHIHDKAYRARANRSCIELVTSISPVAHTLNICKATSHSPDCHIESPIKAPSNATYKKSRCS